MSWFYRHVIRPVLFAQDPEDVHNLTVRLLGWAGRRAFVREMVRAWFAPADLPCQRFGLRFPNPVGLAAGMDKDGEALPMWHALGFGFVELGAVTRQGQPGNPRPRVFRIPSDQAIINRMGFNNRGARALAHTLESWRKLGAWPPHPVGINLGKSRHVPAEQAPEDYAETFEVLWDHADFFVVNVSSPNTPGLRDLQDKGALRAILAALQESNARLGANEHPPKPLCVKVAPDLSFHALDEVVELALEMKLAGIVATNTTLARPEQAPAALRPLYEEAGGLSGKPLRQRATECIQHIYAQTQGALPIIGVGGIFTADDAWEKVVAGAGLVQVYTGLVYEGPMTAYRLVEGLREKLERHGFRDLDEAVGLAVREPSLAGKSAA